MSRFVIKHQQKQSLKNVSPERVQSLAEWIYMEIEDALSLRKPLEAEWRTCLKMYNGVPKLEVRDIPIPNAPNIEITIGAIAADTIYAQSVDLIWGTSPLVTVRPKPKFKDDMETVSDAKAMQRWVNHIASSEDVNLRPSSENSILDDIQLGTGVLYTPYIEARKKTKTATILNVGPRAYSIPVEDCIPFGGGSTDDIQSMPGVSLRFYYNTHQVVDAARANTWNLEGLQPLHAKDWVRSTREMLAKQQDGIHLKGNIFDIHYIWCYYDIDGDGIDEDLFVVWNHSGRSMLYYNYAPEDRRPIDVMVYQKRAHLLNGLGVLMMLAPFEEKLSDVHNYSTLNILLANSRVWVGDESMPETVKIWPGKYLQTVDPDKFKSLQMADVYNSIWQDQLMTMQIANQRVGINEVSQGSQIPSRTPGITAMSFLQQVNRRFTPAFDAMKNCICGSLRQSCYRYKERLLAGDKRAEVSIFDVLGYEDGMRVIKTLTKDTFEESVDMELTAASASINREADRQNAIMLTNILAQYYQRTIELIMLASNPETPPEVASVARKIASAAGEIIDRTVRTFDQIRDPGTFIVEVENELNSIQTTAQDQQALMQLMQAFGGMLQPQQPL